MKKQLLAIVLGVAACGDSTKTGSPGDDPLVPVVGPSSPPRDDRWTYGEPCEEALPPDMATQISRYFDDNMAARSLAIAAEQARLGVAPLLPTTILGDGYYGQNEFLPEVDPFPESIVAVGKLDYDIRTNGYQMNHGKMDMENVYETAPGSGKFFIVDMISGDGLGSNTKDVIGYSVEYGLLDLADDLNGRSWHSWQVSPDNLLVRATQKVEETVVKEISVCGCGYREEVEAGGPGGDGDTGISAPQAYNVAIFMLPAATLPRISVEVFEAKFNRVYVKQKYVPKQGKTCREPDIGPVAC